MREAAGSERGGRTIDVPDDLAAALGDESRTFFDSLPYSHRKEYVDWIVEAKRPETRQRRVEKAVAMLRNLVRHP